MSSKVQPIILIFALFSVSTEAIRCYSCASEFYEGNWDATLYGGNGRKPLAFTNDCNRIEGGPGENSKIPIIDCPPTSACVEILTRSGGENLYIRGCLSNLTGTSLKSPVDRCESGIIANDDNLFQHLTLCRKDLCNAQTGTIPCPNSATNVKRTCTDYLCNAGNNKCSKKRACKANWCVYTEQMVNATASASSKLKPFSNISEKLWWCSQINPFGQSGCFVSKGVKSSTNATIHVRSKHCFCNDKDSCNEKAMG